MNYSDVPFFKGVFFPLSHFSSYYMILYGLCKILGKNQEFVIWIIPVLQGNLNHN
jgi:hypothetical protein